jgi:hypothetical protein
MLSHAIEIKDPADAALSFIKTNTGFGNSISQVLILSASCTAPP